MIGRAGIRTRSTLGATIAVMIALVAGAVLLVTVHRRQLTSELNGAARVHAADLATLLADGALPTSLAVRGDDEALVQILDPSGKVVAASQNISGELPVASDRPTVGPTVAEISAALSHRRRVAPGLRGRQRRRVRRLHQQQ